MMNEFKATLLYLNFNFSFIHVLQQQLQMFGGHVLEEDDMFLLAESPEEVLEVGGADAEHQLMGGVELGPSRQHHVGELLVLAEQLRTRKEKVVMVIPLQQEVLS